MKYATLPMYQFPDKTAKVSFACTNQIPDYSDGNVIRQNHNCLIGCQIGLHFRGVFSVVISHSHAIYMRYNNMIRHDICTMIECTHYYQIFSNSLC